MYHSDPVLTLSLLLLMRLTGVHLMVSGLNLSALQSTRLSSSLPPTTQMCPRYTAQPAFSLGLSMWAHIDQVPSTGLYLSTGGTRQQKSEDITNNYTQCMSNTSQTGSVYISIQKYIGFIDHVCQKDICDGNILSAIFVCVKTIDGKSKIVVGILLMGISHRLKQTRGSTT